MSLCQRELRAPKTTATSTTTTAAAARRRFRPWTIHPLLFSFSLFPLFLFSFLFLTYLFFMYHTFLIFIFYITGHNRDRDAMLQPFFRGRRSCFIWTQRISLFVSEGIRSRSFRFVLGLQSGWPLPDQRGLPHLCSVSEQDGSALCWSCPQHVRGIPDAFFQQRGLLHRFCAFFLGRWGLRDGSISTKWCWVQVLSIYVSVSFIYRHLCSFSVHTVCFLFSQTFPSIFFP